MSSECTFIWKQTCTKCMKLTLCFPGQLFNYHSWAGVWPPVLFIEPVKAGRRLETVEHWAPPLHHCLSLQESLKCRTPIQHWWNAVSGLHPRCSSSSLQFSFTQATLRNKICSGLLLLFLELYSLFCFHLIPPTWPSELGPNQNVEDYWEEKPEGLQSPATDTCTSHWAVFLLHFRPIICSLQFRHGSVSWKMIQSSGLGSLAVCACRQLTRSDY